MEEDTGKSTHVGGTGGRIHGSDYSLVDYNRAGVPLVEIVGRPDIRTADEARQYVNELRAILVAIGASDAKMEEGSMRVDANVSVRRPGEPLGTRCEIKNLNSLRSLGRAIEYEARRQIELLGDGERVRQETRHWDENDGRTHTLRTKEDADDYRYFPEPDLVPLAPDAAWVEEIRRTHAAAARRAPGRAGRGRGRRRHQRGRRHRRRAGPRRAGGRRHRGRRRSGAGARPHRAQPRRQTVADPVTPAALAALTAPGGGRHAHRHAGQAGARRAGGRRRRRRSRPRSPPPRASRPWTPDALEAAVDAAIAEQAGAWAKYCAGEDKAAGALVGAVMKATRGPGRRQGRHGAAAGPPEPGASAG